MPSTPLAMDRRVFLRNLATAAAAGALPPAAARRAWSLAPTDAEKVAHDPLRPEYHLMPPHNWMNDPNGPIWWQGWYHLFYQLNPHASVWGDMHWGHAISRDMIHWRHEPIALAPTAGGPDSEGCFSGSAVVCDGVPTLIYTGVQNAPPADVTIRDGSSTLRETQLLATAEDSGLTRWKKMPEPVIAAPPAHMQVTGFRDPCPWRESDGWYLGVGSGERGKGGCVLLYRSSDLRRWQYLHPLIQGKPTGSSASNPVDSGDMWECPDFFDLSDRHCLFYSTEGKVVWTTGDYNRQAHRYQPARTGILDHGAYYAPKSFLAPGNRRIFWGWITETRPTSEFAAAGWAGVMSLPRVLGISSAGRLTMQFAPETASLREAGIHAALHNSTARHKLEHLRQEMMLRVSRRTASVSVRLLTGGQSVWSLDLDFAAGSARGGSRAFSLDPMDSGQPALHIFLDASVIEAIIGGMHAVTSRCYVVKPGITELEVAARGGGNTEFTRWPLKAISANRLTT